MSQSVSENYDFLRDKVDLIMDEVNSQGLLILVSLKISRYNKTIKVFRDHKGVDYKHCNLISLTFLCLQPGLNFKAKLNIYIG